VGIAGEPAYQAFNAKYWDENFAREFDRYTSGDPDFPSLVEYVASVTARDDVTPDNVWSAWAGLESDDQSAFLTQLQPEDRITFQSFTGLVDTVVDYVALVTGQEPRDPTDSVVAYLALAADSQRPLVQDYFFRELRDSGREANLGEDLGFRRGQDAIATLFPEARQFAGDLSLAFSRIYTLDGGDITLLAPGGLVNVGLARAPEGCVECANKQPSDLGIVTQGPGDVRIFADDDILVNQSRVFTLKGGDIVMWSSNGDIDAGRGSKSAISAPPPTITVSPDGVVSLAFSDAIAGSGIRGIITDASIEPGDVDLVAPTGTVNAGDAGIGAAGNLNIAAPQVVGLDNIQVGGLSTGVPTDSGGIASSLTGVSSLGSSAAEGATDAVGNAAGGEAPMADEAMGWLDVFVEGFGTGKEEEDEEEKAKRRKKDQ
ncbi:MAG: filamentous hemagglutinin family protein, partial [Gammaproteobacteria bacterium]|nr:filamentous hemagglutinin family protein [Gammaproteobacteria bacterium]